MKLLMHGANQLLLSIAEMFSFKLNNEELYFINLSSHIKERSKIEFHGYFKY